MSVNGEPTRIFIEETDLISLSSKKINVNEGKQNLVGGMEVGESQEGAENKGNLSYTYSLTGSSYLEERMDIVHDCRN